MTTVWPFRPEMHVVESLEWLTDVIRCRSKEYRQCLRTMPRLSWQHEYMLDPAAYGNAVELCRQTADAKIMVPDWPNHVEIPAINSGTVNIPVDASHVPAYSYGSGSLLIWDSDVSYEVCTITTVGSGTITISATTKAHTRPTVAPLRTCTFAQPIASDREASDSYVRAQAAFECQVTEDASAIYGASISYPDYLGSPVVADQVKIINGAREDVTREVSTLDSRTGQVYRTATHTTPNRNGVLAWYTHSRDDLWSRRLWLHSRKGQQKNFWVPSWNQDAVITRDISSSDTTIEIQAMDFADTYDFPVDMAVLSSDATGGWFVRVTSAEAGDPGREILTLDEPFDGAVGAAYIGWFSRMTLSRFSADRIEIQHGTGSTATIVVPITEDPNTP